MKLKRFKLNALSAEGLQQKEMNAIIGGQCCQCSCYWESQGGKTSSQNMNANYGYGYSSTQGCNYLIRCDNNGVTYDPYVSVS